MGTIFNKKEFKSKIPKDIQNVTYETMSDEMMEKILFSYKEIKIPKFIDEEVIKGHISSGKAKELKKKSIINGIREIIKKEKEEFAKNNKLGNKIKKIHVLESESNGFISKEESEFLINVLN